MTTLSIDARLVNLPVVVRDRKGTLVSSLNKEDFVLTVDGTPQPIRYFDHDQNVPLTLGLLVDTSLSQRKVLDNERTASSAFLDDMLTNPKDQAFVIQFARSAELLADLTGSKAKLQEGLKDLGTSSGGDAGDTDAGSSDDGGGSHRQGHGGTVLYDAAFLAADELLAKQKGRKALILLTDGEDRGSRESISSAIEAAQRADTTLYAICYKGSEDRDNNNGFARQRGGGGGYPFPGGGYPGGGYPGGRGGGGQQQPAGSGRSEVDGKKILERMTEETGGRVFEVRGHQDVASIYQQIAEELRAQYRLGFTPEGKLAAPGYHQVDPQLKDAKLKDMVQTRDGYYSGKP